MPRYYRDQQAWKDLQMFLPERLRLDESTAPQEEFWLYCHECGSGGVCYVSRGGVVWAHG
ncbi:hypothetical protein ABG82_24930 [Mycobacteroides immunogenum]|nr:hypothetical protein ABG82_24930 [Mycobacteroides immunogenum]ORV74865.1 hypothetical protein AWC10_01100 [Mycobacteroides immunogenum]